MNDVRRRSSRTIFRKLSSGLAEPGLEGLESAGAAPDLSAARAEAALELARRIAEREWGDALDPALLEKLEKIYLEAGVKGLERLRNEGEDAALPDDEYGGLEAIVEIDGSRPTLQVAQNGSIDTEEELLRSWKSAAQKFSGEIQQVARSVGRIDLGTRHRGTGFVIKDGLILTNRHVLQQIARHRNGEWTFRGPDPNITFDADPSESRQLQFPIKRVVVAGPDRISVPIDYGRLDFAVLECEIPPGGNFPAPVTLESDDGKIDRTRPVYTVGYPAKPETGVYEFSVLKLLFKNVYGVKRFAPGEIDEGLDEIAPTVFGHDATTLGGNSGSCVVDLGDDGQLVAGLHFAGFKEDVNYAHSVARLADALGDLDLTWAASI